jgi:hypothetical protein
MLHFSQPKNQSQIFYEAKCEFTPINYKKPGTIELKTSDGHRSIYNYADGKVKGMEFHISIATVYMKVIETPN